jgi:transposase
MWLFRRRGKDLKPEQQAALEELFDRVPELGEVYHRREELSAIFDAAHDRAAAAAKIDAWCADARASDHDWNGFVDCFGRHRDGILAYFDERKTSGGVEGLNNKARVMIKRCYGLRSVATFWTRLLVEASRLVDRARRQVADLRALAHAIRGSFCRDYT